MAVRLITPPAEMPVTLAEAKLHLRVTHNEEDALITSLIAAATGHLDGWNGFLGKAIIAQTWEYALNRFPSREIRLPFGPLRSVTSVVYQDVGDAEQTLDPINYAVNDLADYGWVIPLNSWPSTFARWDAVRVRYVAGMAANAAAVPPAIRAAVLLLIGHLYEHREAVSGNGMNEVPIGVYALVGGYRRMVA